MEDKEKMVYENILNYIINNEQFIRDLHSGSLDSIEYLCVELDDKLLPVKYFIADEYKMDHICLVQKTDYQKYLIEHWLSHDIDAFEKNYFTFFNSFDFDPETIKDELEEEIFITLL